MGREGFENAKNQLGFCGIWCGSCMGGNGALQELTRKYEETVKRSQQALEKWAPKEFNFHELVRSRLHPSYATLSKLQERWR